MPFGGRLQTAHWCPGTASSRQRNNCRARVGVEGGGEWFLLQYYTHLETCLHMSHFL